MKTSIDDLPDDSFLVALSYLSASELCLIATVNKRLMTLSLSNTLWSPLCLHDWLLDIPVELITPSQSMKSRRIDNVDEANARKLARNDESEREVYHQQKAAKQTRSQRGEIEELITKVLEENEGDCYSQLCRLIYKRYSDEFRGLKPMYKKIKHLWNQLEDFLLDKCPEIHNTLKPGCSKDELAQMKKIDAQIPKSLQCSYRIHNGQSVQDLKGKFGLFGGYSFYDYRTTIYLFDIPTLLMNYAYSEQLEEQDWINNCVAIAGYKRVIILLVLKDFSLFEGKSQFSAGQIVQATSGAPIVLADSYYSWFGSYVNNLTQKNMYDVEKGNIIRFPNSAESGSDTTTNGIRIQCNALLIPEYSCVEPDEEVYFFSYRIRISMDINESRSKTAQLTTRSWIIQDGNGKIETVNRQPGVIGFHPEMKPGAQFTYCSCTSQSSPEGKMDGFFSFKQKETGIEFDARIDPFVLSVYNHV